MRFEIIIEQSRTIFFIMIDLHAYVTYVGEKTVLFYDVPIHIIQKLNLSTNLVSQYSLLSKKQNISLFSSVYVN